MLFFHTSKYILFVKYLDIDPLFIVLNTFISGTLIYLQNFKSKALWNIEGIFITYSLPLVLLAPFNNSLFIVIGWITGNAFPSVSYPLILL